MSGARQAFDLSPWAAGLGAGDGPADLLGCCCDISERRVLIHGAARRMEKGHGGRGTGPSPGPRGRGRGQGTRGSPSWCEGTAGPPPRREGKRWLHDGRGSSGTCPRFWRPGAWDRGVGRAGSIRGSGGLCPAPLSQLLGFAGSLGAPGPVDTSPQFLPASHIAFSLCLRVRMSPCYETLVILG